MVTVKRLISFCVPVYDYLCNSSPFSVETKIGTKLKLFCQNIQEVATFKNLGVILVNFSSKIIMQMYSGRHFSNDIP